jgi:hypothetical protein
METTMLNRKRTRFDPLKYSPSEIGKARLFQAKDRGLKAIRLALRDIGFTEGPRKHPAHHLPARVFRVDPVAIRKIFARTKIQKVGFDGFVMGLSQDARASFLGACIAAEGWKTSKASSIAISQNEGPFAQAIALCAYLCGYRPLVSTKHVIKGKKNLTIMLGHAFISPATMRRRSQPYGREDVWCPTTTLGTWTMRWSGNIVLTGNSENNLHGVTGFRCRTFEQFLWAASHIDRINPLDCRQWAEANFSIARVGDMYDEYFRSVMNIWTGNGWYEPNPGRRDLDWLRRRYPV